MMLRRLLPFGVLAVLLFSVPAQPQGAVIRYVNHTDTTCGGHAPCYATIQAAVSAAQAGDHVVIQAGTYIEQVDVTGKNNAGGATESQRIVIEADPAAPADSVVLHGSVSQCTQGYAVQFQQSRFVTLRGLVITGAGGQAISLLGGNNASEGIHLEANRIFGNGGASCNGGITIARGNPGTLIANNLVYANGRNGLTFLDTDGGPHYVVENTIHGNAWNGVEVAREHEVWLVNNLVTGNGTAAGSTGGRSGVKREASTSPLPAGIHLLSNLICGNRIGEISGPALDATDSGNLTPTGSEGPGVLASAGCDAAGHVYASVNGADGIAGTQDDSFTPATGSPAIDQGTDPRALGFPSTFDTLLEADFARDGVRPQAGAPGNPVAFDIGAIEVGGAGADNQAPVVTILAPGLDVHVRQSVTVQAQATDDGGGVTSLTLQVGSQSLTATLAPTLPPAAASVTATATWATTGLSDGIYTLGATATDQSGNHATATRTVTVDNTPPDTVITGAPASAITAATAAFAFSGSDNLTATSDLQFAWRIDDGSFTAFSAATTASVSSLTPGSHTFEVKARDRAGNEDPTPALQSFTVVSLAITITEPVDGATVPSGVLLVRGTVTSGPLEVGVSVNGYPALVSGGQWAASVPIDPGSNTLTATALALDDGQASATVTVTASESSAAVLLLVRPGNGPAPLQVSWQVSNQTGRELTLELDPTGTGAFAPPTFTLDDVQTTYDASGLYLPVLRATDDQGTVYLSRTMVLVEDVATVVGRFQSLWAAFKARLQASDIPGALTYLDPVIQPRFQTVFQQLGTSLPTIAAGLGDLQVVAQLDDIAETVLVQVESGVPRLHFVYFRRNTAGQWLIEEM